MIFLKSKSLCPIPLWSISPLLSLEGLHKQVPNSQPGPPWPCELLATITYEDLLRDRLAYGTPESVSEKLITLRDELGLSGFIMESNVGGRIPQVKMLNSVRLFAEEVVPQLRA